MDRQDYINKYNNLLNQPTYKAIPWDPTNTIKYKLNNILKRVKSQTGLDSVTYKSMYLTGCVPQVLWAPQNPQTRHTAKAYCVWLWISHQCKYPKWALNRVTKRLNRPSREVTDGANNQGIVPERICLLLLIRQ